MKNETHRKNDRTLEITVVIRTVDIFLGGGMVKNKSLLENVRSGKVSILNDLDPFQEGCHLNCWGLIFDFTTTSAPGS